MAPVLPISDGRGHLRGDATYGIRATIAYPNNADEQARKQYHTVMTARRIYRPDVQIRGGDPAWNDKVRAWLEQQAREYPVLTEAARVRELHAAIAAELLLTIASLAKHSPAEATVSRSIYLFSRVPRPDFDGLHVPVRPRALWSIWQRFKSVAPLRAALKAAIDAGIVVDGIIKPRDLPEMLSAAVELARFAITFHPPIGRFREQAGPKALIHAAETWMPPPDLALPAVSVLIPPFPDAGRIELKKYP